MKKSHMKHILDHLDVSKMPHIFCPSYMRPNFKSAEMFRNFSPEVQKKIHIVVREEQYDEYKKANPEFDVISLGDYPVNGLASTRQFIFEYAVEHRYPVVIDIDDDIKHVAYMYDGFSGKGDKCAKHTGKKEREDDPLVEQKVLLMAGYISRQVFKEHPDVMLGNIRRQRFSQHKDNSRLKYIINCGPTPRQVTILNVKGLYKMGINRNVKRFDPHGDDIGFCAEILKNGGSLFNIPCLTYDYISEKCDSVVRTPETEKELHAYEYRMLQKYPMRDYLKTTFKDEEGNYMWGDIDWRKYNKLNNSEPIKRRWKEDNYEV